MIPTAGRIVQYTLSQHDANEINRRRDDAKRADVVNETSYIPLVVGNRVEAGETYPLLITRAWGKEESSPVNGQVMLDGNDSLWVTSVVQGDAERTFREFPRV